MKFWLLTHSEELKKANSTGSLSAKVLAQCCEQIVWQRTQPSCQIEGLNSKNTLLIYPIQPSETVGDYEKSLTLSDYQNVVILDGTWQQARKIYNRSPYLKKFRHYEIKGQQSAFKRRRNQLENGLCTAEVILHLLKENSCWADAEKLESEFERFNNLLPERKD